MSRPIGWIILEVSMGLLAAANVVTLLSGGGKKAFEIVLTVGAVAVAFAAEVQRRRARKNAA